jgi:hypothetical protein
VCVYVYESYSQAPWSSHCDVEGTKPEDCKPIDYVCLEKCEAGGGGGCLDEHTRFFCHYEPGENGGLYVAPPLFPGANGEEPNEWIQPDGSTYLELAYSRPWVKYEIPCDSGLVCDARAQACVPTCTEDADCPAYVCDCTCKPDAHTTNNCYGFTSSPVCAAGKCRNFPVCLEQCSAYCGCP